MADAPEVVVLFLGDDDCGKSTFFAKISQDKRVGWKQNIPLLLDDKDQPFTYYVRFSNVAFQLQFYDNNYPQDWHMLQPNVIVLCYDIHKRGSLIGTQRYWTREVKSHFTSVNDLPILLLGMKRDLRSEEDPNGIIYPQEGHRVAQELRCDKYMECSSLTGELIQEVFEDICKSAAGSLTPTKGVSGGGCIAM